MTRMTEMCTRRAELSLYANRLPSGDARADPTEPARHRPGRRPRAEGCPRGPHGPRVARLLAQRRARGRRHAGPRLRHQTGEYAIRLVGGMLPLTDRAAS